MDQQGSVCHPTADDSTIAGVIGFAGLSHLGLVSSVAAAAKGFSVIAFDSDDSVVSAIKAGRFPVLEPGLPELVSQASQRLTFTSDVRRLSECEFVYIALDAPADPTGQNNLRIQSLIDLVWPHVQSPATLVLLSQVPPGFTRKLEAQRMHMKSGPAAIHCQVETLIFGDAIRRALHPERFIIGSANSEDPLSPGLRTFLQAFNCPILSMRYESAELAKIAINCYLVSSLSTTNMLAGVCESIGAEWREIEPALRLDARIGPDAYLKPGLGVGGGNLVRDLKTLRQVAIRTGTDAGLVYAWLENSAWRRDWALRELHKRVLTRSERPRIAVWGVAYKENTKFTENSPGVALIRALRGVDVCVFDPKAHLDKDDEVTVSVLHDPLEACAGADALAIMTPWPVFASIDPRRIAQAMRGKVLIDPFGCIDPSRAVGAGLEYARLGSPTKPQAK